MYKPQVTPVPTTSAGIETFLGYNHNLRIGNGEFYDMENLSPDNYPVMTPRKNREKYWPAGVTNETVTTEGKLIYGMISHGEDLYYVLRHKEQNDKGEDVCPGYLYKDGQTDPVMRLGAGSNNVSRTLLAQGAYILIFPDEMFYNTITGEGGSWTFNRKYGNSYNTTPVEIHLYNEATGYDYTVARDDEYKLDGTYDYYQDEAIVIDFVGGGEYAASLVTHTINKSGESVFKETPVTELTLRIVLPERRPAVELSAGDIFSFYIKHQGCQVDHKKLTIDRAVDTQYERDDGEGTSGVTKTTDIFITVTDINIINAVSGMFWEDIKNRVIDGEVVYTYDTLHPNAFYMSSIPAPKMDMVLECNNRIWGCRYGNSNDGVFVNEIYASRQGSFCHWNAFSGLSTDSYVAAVGPAGKFTGAINFNGRPLFFKENHYWLVSGDYPSQYGYTDAPIIGPKWYDSGVSQINNRRSLVIANRLLYYYAYDGIRVFDGYDSAIVSDPLGKLTAGRCISGVYGNKLYFSMQIGQNEMFVYDIGKGLWYREKHGENEINFNGFCNHRNKLYSYVTTGIYDMEAADSEGVSWYGETGDLLPSLGYKYLHQLSVRMNVPEGASVWISLQYDASGKWEEVFRQNATKQRFLTVPIKPRRCDHLRMRIKGVGPVEVYAINKVYEQGSDV